MNRAMWVLVTVLLIVAYSSMALAAHIRGQAISDLRMTLAWEERRIPLCPEDSVLVGIGDFEGGQWEAYACGPAWDDYE